MRFANGEWHEVGGIDKITRGKDGKIIKVVILFDDGIKQEHVWPNKNIAVIGGTGTAGEKKEKRVRSGTEEEKKGSGNRREVMVDEGGPKMFKCGEEGCEYETKNSSHLKRHKANIHDIDVTYYLCNVDGCEYKAKSAGHLKTHKAMIHDIDVTYYLCNADGCEYKAKDASSLKKHKAGIHDIDVIYYLCNGYGCEYKAKQSGNLNQHKKRIHGIS